MEIFSPIISGSLTMADGAITAEGGITGSLYGTSSWAENAITASYALNAGAAVNTASLLTTASVVLNTITFTKGDGSTFPITVNTGSGGTVSGDYVTTSSFNAFTSSVVTTSSFNTFTGSYNTGSFTGSFVGDGSGLTNIPTQSFETGSFAITGSNTFVGDQIINGENLGLIVDAGGLKRVGFMKYGGLEGSIARVANQNFRILRTTGSDINDGTNAITDFYIAGDGKVGIGTTSPAYTLDVSGSSNFTDGQTIVGSITFPSGTFISSTPPSGNIYISALNNGTLHLNDDGGEGDILMLNGQGNRIRTRGDVEITGSIYLGSGSIISESGSTTIFTPPGAQVGQSLVIRPTSGNMFITASGFIVAGVTLNIILSSSQYSAASQESFYYELSGSTAYQLGLGSLTGAFNQANWVDNGGNTGYNQISIPIPIDSTAATLTMTITGSSGFFGGYVFTNNPFTVTNNGIINNEVSHIHLISGDPTTVDLYLGDDDQYVKIERNAGNVVVGTNSDTHRWTFDTSGSLTAPGKIIAPSFTGSLFGTASWASNAATASNILGGKATHVPFFITDTTLATSSIYQSGSTSVIINLDVNTTDNPEALYVFQPHPTSYNVISGIGDLNNYLQLNIKNNGVFPSASSDVVATANNGNESTNYIDMGINGQNYNVGFIGGANDAYLYSTGRHLHVGNVSNFPVQIFAGGSDVDIHNKLELNPNNQHSMTGSLDVSGSVKAFSFTGSLQGNATTATNASTASFVTTAQTASYVAAANVVGIVTSASHAANADNSQNAVNANFATTAGNGGVTQIVAGTGVSLVPTSGLGSVTVIATGVGGVTIISGSNVTESFNNSTSWNFEHNLGTRVPIITVFDTNYNQIIPQNIELVNTASATITFPTAESGFAVASLGGTTGTVLSSSYALFSTYATTASYVSSNFQYEVHVSQVDGNDTTGNGDLLKPVATIGKALLIVSASVGSTDRRTIIVHPGTYIENITVNTTNTYFFSTGLLGANCLIAGSVTISAATRMSGLKMTNLIVSSSAPVYLNNCAVDNQMTVSGSGYLEVQNTSLQCTSGIQVVGPASSGVIFENCFLYPLTVNNASAAVYVISCNQAITPTLTAGALTITRSTISSLTSLATSTALTTAAGSVLVLESCNVYNSLLTSHAAITANGFYSIKNVIYNKPASTLASLSGTGGPLATISQFQYINADNITTSGLTVTGSLNITGSTTQIGNINLTGSLNVAGGITGSLLGTASYSNNADLLDGRDSTVFATTGSNTFRGNQTITGSLKVSGSLTEIGDTVLSGSLTLSSGSALRINNGFYVDGQKQFNYGQFSSTQTQSGSADTAYSMTFNTTDFSNGVSLVADSRLTVANTGLYNIQFSAQLHTTANQAVDFSVWFAMTGSNIANSNTDFSIEKIAGGGFSVAALNFLTQIASGSYIELKYSKTTLEGQLQAKGTQASPSRPATPSAIVTVTQIA